MPGGGTQIFLTTDTLASVLEHTDEIVKRVKVAVEQQELSHKATAFGGFTLRQWLENIYIPAEYDRILRHDPRNQ